MVFLKTTQCMYMTHFPRPGHIYNHKNLLWKTVRLHCNVSMICCYNLTGYSRKQTDDVINTTTNILREMSYHIVHMLLFHAGYNISIISLSFLVVYQSAKYQQNKGHFLDKNIICQAKFMFIQRKCLDEALAN